MRICVGMSGGVDSSLAAHLVAEAGHEVVGVTMQLWPCAESDGGFTREDACCSPTETIDARSVAQSRGIRHYVVDLVEEFRRGVVDDFTAGWAAGSTPNPCIRCNEKIKFAELWRWAQGVGCDRVATGHYARTGQAPDGRWLLRTAVDTAKDQTYFLFSLTQDQLAHADFPVGHLTKPEVREAARTRRLATADKHESQDICFVGTDGVEGFLRRNAPEAFRPGPIIGPGGAVVGEHRGLPCYTVGQRRGLGLHQPWFVLGKDVERNALVVGPREDLLVREEPLTAVTWHPGALPAGGADCLVRTRHRGPLLPAVIAPSVGGAVIRHPEPRQRTAPGQAVVCYSLDGQWCLGGGWAGPA